MWTSVSDTFFCGINLFKLSPVVLSCLVDQSFADAEDSSK